MYDHIDDMMPRIKKLKQDLVDARSYVAEVAQGVTHYPHDDDTPCVRCELEWLQKGLADIKRHCGHVKINNGTSTLGLFVDLLLKRTS